MVPPRADDRGNAGDRADRHAAAVVALHAVVEPDQRRLLARQAMGQLFDRFDVDAGDRRHFFGAIFRWRRDLGACSAPTVARSR